MFIPQEFIVKPSAIDSRDFVYATKHLHIKPELDLRKYDSIIESQGSLGSCVGNAITNTFELMINHRYPQLFVELSRLFVYYNARKIEGTINSDIGVYEIRNALKGTNHYGICSEELWKYDISKFTVEPPYNCYDDAKKRKVILYEKLTTSSDVFESLNLIKPVIVGFYVFVNFLNLTKENSTLEMPNEKDYILGGHAVNIVGYSLNKKAFLAKNSFGDDWGDDGYFWLPFEYANKYVFEYWNFEISVQHDILIQEGNYEEYEQEEKKQ
jgi:C1A family cysteine protease